MQNTKNDNKLNFYSNDSSLIQNFLTCNLWAKHFSQSCTQMQVMVCKTVLSAECERNVKYLKCCKLLCKHPLFKMGLVRFTYGIFETCPWWERQVFILK